MRGGRRGPWGGQCIANITREDKHRVPLSDNCAWGCEHTDLAAVSAPKRLQKQGHCEHRGGVRSTMVSLKITRVSNPKKKRKRNERERKGEKKEEGKEAESSSKQQGAAERPGVLTPLIPNCHCRCGTKHRDARVAAGQHRAGGTAPLPAPRDPARTRTGQDWTSSTQPWTWLGPQSEAGQPQAQRMEKVLGKDPRLGTLRGFTIRV